MATELPEKVTNVLEQPTFWHLATVNPDGSPHTTAVWVDLRDGKILVNSALGRKKPRNIEQNPRVAMSWHSHEGGTYQNMAIQGRVVDTYTGDRAEADIDSLAKKYIGQDVYPWRAPGEQRVSFVIEPTHVLAYGG